MNRRALLKGATGAAIGVSALTASITQASTGTAPFFTNLRQDQGEVVIYTWYQPWIDAVKPLFEEETGIKVVQHGTYSTSDEWWARLQAGEKIDFFMPSTAWVERARDAELLHPIDLDKIPNIANLYEEYQGHDLYTFDGEVYASPFSRYFYCMTYNTGTFPETPTSWAECWDEQYAGKVTMQDAYWPMVGTTALLLGDDPHEPTDWGGIEEKLLDIKGNVTKFWEDYQIGMEMFINEEVLIGLLSDGRTRMGQEAGGEIAWTIPDEGCLIDIDSFAIPKNAPNPDNAHAFIDFLHRADITAMEMRDLGYNTVNEAAVGELDADMAEAFAVPEDATTIVSRGLSADVRTRMSELWTEVKLS